jgi:hypothetical protein
LNMVDSTNLSAVFIIHQPLVRAASLKFGKCGHLCVQKRRHVAALESLLACAGMQ